VILILGYENEKVAGQFFHQSPAKGAYEALARGKNVELRLSFKDY